jgi:hypothetical protein
MHDLCRIHRLRRRGHASVLPLRSATGRILRQCLPANRGYVSREPTNAEFEETEGCYLKDSPAALQELWPAGNCMDVPIGMCV